MLGLALGEYSALGSFWLLLLLPELSHRAVREGELLLQLLVAPS